jgi:hypothetical protein
VAIEDEETCVIHHTKNVKLAKRLLTGKRPTANSTPLIILETKYDVKGFNRLFAVDKIQGCHARLLDDGEVQIYELPNRQHEIVSANVYEQLFTKNNCTKSNRSADIVNQTLLQPDGSLLIRPPSGIPNMVIPGSVDHMANTLPKIVIEVSCTEPYDSIAQLPKQYFAAGRDGDAVNGIPTVQGVIIFIIRRSKCAART